MAFTTLAALVSTISGLSVTGVVTQFAYRPRRVSAAQLPVMYCRPPTRKRENSTLGYAQGLKAATIEIVILVEFLELSTQVANDALTVTLIDTLGDVLEANAAALDMDGYTITTDEDTIGDGSTPVQAIIATVEVSA